MIPTILVDIPSHLKFGRNKKFKKFYQKLDIIPLENLDKELKRNQQKPFIVKYIPGKTDKIICVSRYETFKEHILFPDLPLNLNNFTVIGYYGTYFSEDNKIVDKIINSADETQKYIKETYSTTITLYGSEHCEYTIKTFKLTEPLYFIGEKDDNKYIPYAIGSSPEEVMKQEIYSRNNGKFIEKIGKFLILTFSISLICYIINKLTN